MTGATNAKTSRERRCKCGGELATVQFRGSLMRVGTVRELCHQRCSFLISWEFPRLCRGGSRSFTFAGVISSTSGYQAAPRWNGGGFCDNQYHESYLLG